MTAVPNGAILRSLYLQGRHAEVEPVLRRSIEMTPAEQRRRFIETARELWIPETEAAQEQALGKVGLKKPKKRATKKE